jgi:hypothetical protein
MIWPSGWIHLNQICLITETIEEVGVCGGSNSSFHGTFYSYDRKGQIFESCENDFRQTVVCLNRKIDLHNLTS